MTTTRKRVALPPFATHPLFRHSDARGAGHARPHASRWDLVTGAVASGDASTIAIRKVDATPAACDCPHVVDAAADAAQSPAVCTRLIDAAVSGVAMSGVPGAHDIGRAASRPGS